MRLLNSIFSSCVFTKSKRSNLSMCDRLSWLYEIVYALQIRLHSSFVSFGREMYFRLLLATLSFGKGMGDKQINGNAERGKRTENRIELKRLNESPANQRIERRHIIDDDRRAKQNHPKFVWKWRERKSNWHVSADDFFQSQSPIDLSKIITKHR